MSIIMINKQQFNEAIVYIEKCMEGFAPDTDKYLELLIIKGADVDSRGFHFWTPLMVASKNGLVNIAEILIENGADINAMEFYGWTPLMIASSEGHYETVKLLLEKGADISLKSSTGQTALQIAIERDKMDIAQLFQ